MSDYAQGGRIVYERPQGQATLELRIDFEGQETPWTHPLAANGRKLSRFSIDGVRWVPLDFDFQEIFEDGKRVAIEFEGERYALEKTCRYLDVGGALGRCSECGAPMGSLYVFCRHCGARLQRKKVSSCDLEAKDEL